MPARLLVIGLDAYDKDLLLEWAAAGDLPALAALLQRAAWGVAQGPPALYAGAVWPSFSTGTSPAHHRRFFRRQAPRGDYVDADFKPTDIEGTPFWEVLSDAGRRVAVFDVPHSKLSPRLNGIQVVDWSVHEPEFERALTYPAALRDAIVSGFGPEALDRCDRTQHTPEGYRALLATLAARLRNATAISRHYLASADWDFFLTVFSEAHCAGHQFWALHDTTHPCHDPALAALTGDLMKEVYVALDRAVGEIVEEAGDDTRVIVLCSHGMGPLYGESVAFDEALRRLEPSASTAGLILRGLRRSWRSVPSSLRYQPLVRSLRLRAQRPLIQSLVRRDRRARRFFTIAHNAHGGAIRINVAGREANGLVRPGDEYRAVCAELCKELSALRCAQTNQKVVAEVAITADLYDGPFADELPDVLIEWNRSVRLRTMCSPRVGTVAIPDLPGRSGDHKREGLFLAAGPGVRAGHLERAVPIVDFAPTIASMLDVPVPAVFTGRPIRELLE